MKRIDTASRVIDLFGAGKDGYGPGNPSTNTRATDTSASAFNAMQEEIASVIEGAGLVLDAANNAQILQALNVLFAPKNMDFGNLP